MKRFLSVLLTVALVFGTANTVFASDLVPSTGDIVEITGSEGYEFLYQADEDSGSYYASYMYAALIKCGDQTGSPDAPLSNYYAWCSTYGVAIPNLGQKYKLTLLNGNSYNDSGTVAETGKVVGEIPLSWTISCIKAAEHISGQTTLSPYYQAATELAIRCASDAVEVEKLTNIKGAGSANAEAFCARTGKTVTDFYATVLAIYNRAKDVPYEYDTPTEVAVTDKGIEPYDEDGYKVLAEYDLNVEGLVPSIERGSNGIEVEVTGKLAKIKIPLSEITADTYFWVVGFTETSTRTSYYLYQGTPVNDAGQEISNVQRLIIYQPKMSNSYDFVSGVVNIREPDLPGQDNPNESSEEISDTESSEDVSEEVSEEPEPEPNVGTIRIEKTSYDGVVEGFTFAVFCEETGFYTTVKTDEDGLAYVGNLPIYGTDEYDRYLYEITELNVPNRYDPNDSAVYLNPNGETTVVSVYNADKREALGHITVRKTADGLNRGELEGFKFRVTSSEGNEWTITTGTTGVANTHSLRIFDDNLRKIEYTVQEIDVPSHFIAPPPQTVTLDMDNRVTVYFHNELRTGTLIINKSTPSLVGDTGTVFEFRISAEGYEDVFVEVGANDSVVVEDLLISDDNGALITYTVEEINTPSGFIAPSPQTVTLSKEEPTEVDFVNVANTGTLVIKKTADDNIIDEVSFLITPSEGEPFVLTTNPNGYAESQNLAVYGTNGEKVSYSIEEIDIPARYENTAPETVELTLGNVTEVTFHNKLVRGSLRIEKDSEDGKTEGFVFLVTPSYGDSFVLTTDEDGIAVKAGLRVFDADNELIVYTVEEQDVSHLYYKPETQTTTLVGSEETTVNIYNVAVKGNIRVQKSSEDGVVEGFTFSITSDFGDSIEVTTLEDGTAEVTGLRVYDDNGQPIVYTVNEVGDYDRYYEPEMQTTSLIADETTVLSFENRAVRGTLTILKTSEDGIVEGFRFEVTSSFNHSFVLVTDSEGKAVEAGLRVYDDNGEPILYTVQEIDVPARYVKPDSVSVSLVADSETSLSFHNELVKGSLLIKKNSEDNRTESREFEVVSSDGESFVLLTDKNGLAKAEGLRVYDSNNEFITYTVTEINVPKEYYAPEPQTKTLVPDSETVFGFYNEAVKSHIVINKTSEDGRVDGFSFKIEPSFGDSFVLVTDRYGYAESEPVRVYDDDGGLVRYTVTEINVPSRYISPEPIHITLPSDEPLTVKIHNELRTGSLTVFKTDETGIPMDGVSFILEVSSNNGQSWSTLRTGTTDATGRILFDGLEQSLLYALTETETKPGYSLCPDTVWTGCIGEFGLYDVSVSVRNDLVINLPNAGGHGLWLTGLGVMMFTAFGGLLVFMKKRDDDSSDTGKEVKNNEE